MFGLSARISNIVAGGLGGVTLVLLVLLLVADGRVSRWQKLDAAHVAQRDAEIAKNAVNLKSIADLTAALKAKNAESDARAKALADVKAQDARDVAEADKRYADTAGRIKALEAIARGSGGKDACKVPGAVSGALEGL